MALELKRDPKKNRFGLANSARRNTPNVRRNAAKAKTARININVGPGLRRVLSWSGGIVLGMCFFACLSLGLLVGYRYLTGGNFFGLRTVEIHGNAKLTREDIIEQAGLFAGRNTLEINLSDMKDKLLELPWIQEVSLKRVLPDGFSVYVKEKQPVYLISEDEKLFYADQRAAVIAPVDAEGFIALPQLVVDGLDERALADLPSVMEQLSGSNVFNIHEAAWIKVGLVEGLELYFSKPKLRVRLDNEAIGAQLARINMVWADLAHRGEAGDVRGLQSIGPNVWVEYNKKTGA